MKKTILINGAVRDIEEFVLIIDCLLEQRKKSEEKIEIIISTWHEDINKNLQLFRWIASNDIKVVGSAGIDSGGPANIFRQWRTLEAGLSIVSSDSLILKGRTDKFLLRKDVIEAFVKAEGSDPALQMAIKQDKLAVEHISLSLPFMAKDMIYIGTVTAIRKIMHYSVRTKYVADHIFHGIGPECFLWLESCSSDQELMQLIQKIDFRFISNELMKNNCIFEYDWSQIKPQICLLYSKWYHSFDSNFTFLSDIIKCHKSPSWVINEGLYKYQTGDREDYERLRFILESVTPTSLLNCASELCFLNSTDTFTLESNSDNSYLEWKPELPFLEDIDRIRNDYSREYSDIVLLRSKLIQRMLVSQNPDPKKLTQALKWNIRQRDNETLNMVYNWMMSADDNIKYVSHDDRLFVLERILDSFTFIADNVAIENTIEILKDYFKKSPQLSVRVAESYFRKGKLYYSLYWFWLSYKGLPGHLGVNHGLGCTLLDLGFPRLALKYLRQANAIQPQDQTASFTLIRCLARCNKKSEAKILMNNLSGHLRVEAERILNAD
ncbi:tetratricopeptide repeat protein [Escherichia coli]|uniref:Uncharacterized protein n=2 Tax=Escherichia coli TaxID=562 RepID=A0A0A8J5C0_ECOLX|nr:tetratricopeptide repeat protein [Escherichia coli]AIG62862.1 hypothetical protein [Escherichia coli]EFL6449389.1 tetratricopeptide repeat protein [Escherichia coli]EZJ85383.1 wavE lipopolysaccharide synthesis family protein [Escherichia coli 1-250-04_S3_C1]KEO32911.1 wavE lipopolysaccharide synthesis family protein [Escherichia coli 1-250-04_S3_C2]MCH0687082.1 tetratricopeptide repeat protein [Escherichia coli]